MHCVDFTIVMRPLYSLAILNIVTNQAQCLGQVFVDKMVLEYSLLCNMRTFMRLEVGETFLDSVEIKTWQIFLYFPSTLNNNSRALFGESSVVMK